MISRAASQITDLRPLSRFPAPITELQALIYGIHTLVTRSMVSGHRGSRNSGSGHRKGATPQFPGVAHQSFLGALQSPRTAAQSNTDLQSPDAGHWKADTSHRTITGCRSPDVGHWSVLDNPHAPGHRSLHTIPEMGGIILRIITGPLSSATGCQIHGTTQQAPDTAPQLAGIRSPDIVGKPTLLWRHHGHQRNTIPPGALRARSRWPPGTNRHLHSQQVLPRANLQECSHRVRDLGFGKSRTYGQFPRLGDLRPNMQSQGCQKD
ncbi:unnamed protein product [Caretta caretta]